MKITMVAFGFLLLLGAVVEADRAERKPAASVVCYDYVYGEIVNIECK